MFENQLKSLVAYLNMIMRRHSNFHIIRFQFRFTMSFAVIFVRLTSDNLYVDRFLR
jgi:hypothetical protein